MTLATTGSATFSGEDGDVPLLLPALKRFDPCRITKDGMQQMSDFFRKTARMTARMTAEELETWQGEQEERRAMERAMEEAKREERAKRKERAKERAKEAKEEARERAKEMAKDKQDQQLCRCSDGKWKELRQLQRCLRLGLKEAEEAEEAKERAKERTKERAKERAKEEAKEEAKVKRNKQDQQLCWAKEAEEQAKVRAKVLLETAAKGKVSAIQGAARREAKQRRLDDHQPAQSYAAPSTSFAQSAQIIASITSKKGETRCVSGTFECEQQQQHQQQHQRRPTMVFRQPIQQQAKKRRLDDQQPAQSYAAPSTSFAQSAQIIASITSKKGETRCVQRYFRAPAPAPTAAAAGAAHREHGDVERAGTRPVHALLEWSQ
jgi:hypothetical protein